MSSIVFLLLVAALAVSYAFGRMIWDRLIGADVYYYRLLYCSGSTVALTGALLVMAFSNGALEDMDSLVWINVLQVGVSISLLLVLHYHVGWGDIGRSLKADRKYVFYGAMFFALGIALGALVQDQAYELATQQIEGLEEIAELSVDRPAWEIMAILLGNNTKTAILLGMVLPVIPLIGGMYVAFSMFLNGAVIGVIGSFLDKPMTYLFVGILPHGIFEIPAIVIAAAIGLKLNSKIMFGLLAAFTSKEKESAQVFYVHVKEGLKSLNLMYLVIFLLIIAAMVESTITPYLLSMLE